MRIARFAALLSLLAVAGVAAATSSAGVSAPTGLHAFLLRADEPAQTSFSRTPAFAWNPVPGALHYEFQLSLSNTFRDNAVVYADLSVTAPVEAPGITLPWITGDPHSLYARVRAITTAGATPWSAGFGFDMVPPAAPAPLPSYPGALRWTPVEGAAAYEVWLVDIPKFVAVTTNVLDERDFYTFHQSANWTGTVRWRIRAIRDDIQFAGTTGTGRYNQIPIVQYGPWSPIYSSSNPAFTGGPIKLVGTLSDVFSDGSDGSPAHELMPAFLWTGNQSLGGTAAELYRVYVFSDKQCLNPVFVGSVVGSPAYAPRPYGSLILPNSPAGIAQARNMYLQDGTEPQGYMYDYTALKPNEDQPHVNPQTTVAGTPGSTTSTTGTSTSTSTSTSSSSSPGSGRPAAGTLVWSGDFGAPVDLWDTDWPQSGYYWTVIPVAAEVPGALQTSVASPGATLGSSSLPVANSAGFQVGDAITIGSGGSAENATVAGVATGTLTLTDKLASNHGAGELVARSGGSLIYRDMELPQDACAAGRIARFGVTSEPALTSEGDLFATGLSSTGRLTSALHTTAFYGAPLVSWTPALGAGAYEVQWSKTSYPFVPQQYPGATFAGFMTATTSAVLPVGPGTWYYRVRGYDYSLPTSVQQMTWSDPEKIVVAKPKFAITSQPKTKFKILGKSK
ncbi:MAG TPA: hypothetical protein VII51_01500 [Gaiellaceae bacterium]